MSVSSRQPQPERASTTKTSSTMAHYVSSLRRCSHCNAVQDSTRCAGCFGVMYCSKECQKRAWREHKRTLQRQPPSALF
ncbi:hypothetical protein C8T65DRAFT_657726 [Cerioporus squamosus]|nr:hypothetical protein C8T65DRAFT_674600 [Cerioporus squamosus]KAI0700556.1 hypothetical protein C8T65DRAFT_657726 [Cerioporus squamosus]